MIENRQARFNYYITDTCEVGIILTGPEVKAIRAGKITIAESYVHVDEGELWLVNATINSIQGMAFDLQNPKRKRKLLAKKKQICKFHAEVQRNGMTIVPLKMYFNDKGILKVLIGLGKGKNNRDKRDTIMDREWKIKQARLLKH